MAKELEGPAIGIDLGMTSSCAGVWLNNKVEIVINGQGNRTTPSCVAFTDNECLIGDAAEEQCITNPTNTIIGAKRFIGKRFDDSDAQCCFLLYPYEITNGPKGEPNVVVNYKGEQLQFSAEEISSMILRNMRENAETKTGKMVKNAVVTVPAYFNSSQRRATQTAGQNAGLNVMKIINEPIAAVVGHGLHNLVNMEERNVLVFHLGGGTLDVSVVNINRGHLLVKANAGDMYLGGENFTERMVIYFTKILKRTHGRDLSGNPKALRNLRKACEKAKRLLSYETETAIELDCLHKGIEFEAKITRSMFEDLNKDLFRNCIGVVGKCISEANMMKESIHDVVLVGMSTRIPKVEELLKQFFHGTRISNSKPDEIVALGATMLAAKLVGEGGGKEVQDLHIHDVTALSLGIEKISGTMRVLIPNNTPIPTRKDCFFTTMVDNQRRIIVSVYEGEGTIVEHNNFLGEFELDGIPPAPSGTEKIMVSFNVDSNGVLTIIAKDRSGSGLRKETTITYENCRLRSAESEREFSTFAEVHTEENKEESEKEDANKDKLENLIPNLTTTLSSNDGENSGIPLRNSTKELRNMRNKISKEATGERSMAGRYSRPAIGIDLGTSYSCVGVWWDGRVEIIQNEQGNRTTRSLVAFTETETLIGEAAENQWMANSTGTIYGAKRLIGRRFDDEFVQNHIKYCLFEVGRGTDGRPVITVHHQGQRKEFYAEDISSMILGYMRTIAIQFTGKDITNAVITVPAYFNNSQREATKNAGRLAGLNVMRIINEPIAAAISHGLHADGTMEEKKVLIFDLGSGTFDVSLVKIRGHNFTVMATAGDPYLGGEDFNNRMVGYLCEEFERRNGIDIRNNPRSIRRMREACERAKRILSAAVETTIELEYLHGNIPLFQTRITRAQFEEINMDLFIKCIHIVDDCLRDASINRTDVNSVVLEGGSSGIPKIAQLLLEHFKQINLLRSDHPNASVAVGATIFATKLVGDGGDNLRNLQVVDITTLSLGVKHASGVMSVFIPRNTEIPARKEIVFTTGVDNQDSVYVGVYEGERTIASENNFLGGFNLRGIPKALAGVPQIYVCFEIDMDGVLTVSARNGANGPRMEIIITNEERAAGTEASDRTIMDGVNLRNEEEEKRKRLVAMGALRFYIENLRSRLTTENRGNHDDTRRMNLEESINTAATWLDENPSVEAAEYKAKKTELESMWRRAFAKGWLHFRH